MMEGAIDPAIPDDEASITRSVSLPAWIYRDPEYFAVECDEVLRPSWQVVCHLADVPAPGDFQTFDFIGEHLVVVRGDDGHVRAFHNVCRHRAARILDGSHGNCGRTMMCPYHAWSYDLAGRLVGVPFRSSFAIDPADLGLKPVEMEIWHGFVFVRLVGGGPSVAEMMSPYEAEVAPDRKSVV
jgi:phenylpropionate dioxygenase-like ring-hydroxylating dioxygenase large terminal subunit